MNINVKKLCANAVIPVKAHKSDAGFDLVATSKKLEHGCLVYGTGLAFEIPEGHVGLVFPRSSVANTSFTLSNCVGVIDSGYRGEVMLKFKIYKNEYLPNQPWVQYEVGERIGQMIIMPIPDVSLVEAEALSDSDRGTGGYGSTGK